MFSPAEESQIFLQLTALCQDPTLVGMKLLEKISSVPHGELSCSKLLAIFSHVLGPSRALRSLLLDPCSLSGPLLLRDRL